MQHGKYPAKKCAKQEDNRTKTNQEDNWFGMEIYAAWQLSCLKSLAKQEDNRTKTKTNQEDNWFQMEIYAAWQFCCLKSVQSVSSTSTLCSNYSPTV